MVLRVTRHASCLVEGMRPHFLVTLLGCTGLLLASSCGETHSASVEESEIAGAASSSAGKPAAAGNGSGGFGGSDSAGRGGSGGGSAGTVHDPCAGVPPPQSKCVSAEQAWEWSRNSGAAAPLPTPGGGGEGGVGNGGAGGEGGATYPPGTCPTIYDISQQLGANGTGLGIPNGNFNNGQCCYIVGVACG